MGVHCEISLFKSSDGVFKPGDNVRGVIKYAVDEETKFSKITMSLKGLGFLRVKKRNTNTNNKQSDVTYTTAETYVDEDHVIKDVNKETIVPFGSYQLEFEFKLPKNVPASLDCYKRITFHQVWCNINYYVRIKFERPGFMKFAKRFKKEIVVVSGMQPKLQDEPVVYGEQKTLTQWFSSKKSIVNLKAAMEKSQFTPGEKIQLSYELLNDTNITIKAVDISLCEKYEFTLSHGYQVKSNDIVKNTDTKTSMVKSRETQNMDVDIAVPSDISSLEFSKIVSKDYYIRIEVCIPLPHRNLTLEVPVQIGDIIQENIEEVPNHPPPSYWEAMGEYQEDEKEEKS